jgi:enoyl-CoA hydratase/carnithine racemase
MAYWSVDIDDSVAVLTFTRAPRNVMSLAAMTELADALDDLAARTDEVTVVVLTGGVDGYFIADADRDELARLGGEDAVDGDPNAWFRALSTLESMPQPTVAAIDGEVERGGCATALACTLRIGSERAHVGKFEVNVGIVGSDSAPRLGRLVGSAVCAELLLTGRVIDADEARRMGLLNDVLPAEGFHNHVRQWCERITKNPPPTVFDAKRAVIDGFGVTHDEVVTIATSMKWLIDSVAAESTVA